MSTNEKQTADEEPDPLQTHDNPLTGHFHVDDVSGVYDLGGMIRIIFEHWHCNPYASPERGLIRVCAGRLVMSAEAAEKLAKAILYRLEQRKNPPPQPVSTPSVLKH